MTQFRIRNSGSGINTVRVGSFGRGRVITVSTSNASQLIPVFQSDWADQLGTSLTARLDGDKWTQRVDGGVEVIASTGLGFPSGMAKVIQIPWNQGGLQHVDNIVVPSVGTTRYYRWYMRIDIPDGVTSDTATHPVQDGFSQADSNWMFHLEHNVAGNGFWRPYVTLMNNPYPYLGWTAENISLAKGVVYRIEVAVEVLSTTTYNFSIRIYNPAGTLVAGDADFIRTDSFGAETLANTAYTFLFRNINELHGLNSGTNDSGTEGGIYGYQGGFAVCDNQGWIGEYGRVQGEYNGNV